MNKNLIYVQSGGVSSVINVSAAGVIETAKLHPEKIGRIYAAAHGIRGLLDEDIYDVTDEPQEKIDDMKQAPGGIFGSGRHRMPPPQEDDREYRRLLAIFKAHKIGYFLYNGGGGSMDAANKLSDYCTENNFPVSCIGIPKTIDNDLDHTDNCPGYGSVAKFTAVSALESGQDVAAMYTTSTKVLLIEVMGRHAGWIAAAAGLARQHSKAPPHLIIFPEIPLNKLELMDKIKHCVQHIGYCVIIVAEGARGTDGEYLSAGKGKFGGTELGGASSILAVLIKQLLNYKYHCVVSDYLQRSARHLSSQVDYDHAYAVGKAAVEYAVSGKRSIMPVIVRQSSFPYKWKTDAVSLDLVANSERFLPADYINKDRYTISEAAREHILPLIQGEAYPTYHNGLPRIARRGFKRLPKQLPAHS